MSFLLSQKLLKLDADMPSIARQIQRQDIDALARVKLTPSGIDRRFQRLLSAPEWASLSASVQRRFLKRLGPGQSVVYRGQIVAMKMNRLGWLLAQCARAIGAPLPVDRHGSDNAAMVTVSDDDRGGGQVWTRVYCRRNRFPQAVNSVKRFAGPTGLEEHIGAGIAMALYLKVDHGNILFIADHYFVNLFGRKIRLPKFLSPGTMTVGHHDLSGQGSDQRFLFTLDLRHPVFGHLIHQSILFADMEEPHHG